MSQMGSTFEWRNINLDRFSTVSGMDDFTRESGGATETSSQVSGYFRTPREKIDDIERRLVRPSTSSSQRKVAKKLRVYEDW